MKGRAKTQTGFTARNLIVGISACALLSGCIQQKKADAVFASLSAPSGQNGSSNSTPSAQQPDAPQPPAPPPASIPVPVTISSTGTAGIRDFTQVVPAMAAVTGVSMSDSSVQTYYNNAVTRMSVDGSGTAVSSALLATYTTLASIFCQKLVAREAPPNGPAVLFSDLSFTAGTAGLTSSVRTAMMTKLTNQFWGRNPSPGELTTFNTMLDEISTSLSGVGSSSTEKTKTVALSACTAVLSSLDFLKN